MGIVAQKQHQAHDHVSAIVVRPSTPSQAIVTYIPFASCRARSAIGQSSGCCRLMVKNAKRA